MAPQSFEVGPLEMKVLGILDGTKARSVSDIQAALKKSGQDLAYTTVMTVLVRLFNKSYLKRKKDGRQYLYFSSQQKGVANQTLFEKIRKSLFRNERLTPILALLDSDQELTTNELKELRQVVDERLKKSGDRK